MAPDAALWAGAVMVLAGVAMGFGMTVYGALRAAWRLPRGVGDVVDVLVVVAWGLPVALGLLVAAWGTVRLWTVVTLLVGLGVWAWLGAPLTGRAVRACAERLARAMHWLWAPCRRHRRRRSAHLSPPRA